MLCVLPFKISSQYIFPIRATSLIFSPFLHCLNWYLTIISSTNLNWSKYLLHHDSLKIWCGANLTSSAALSIRVTTCYPLCYDPFDYICKLVNNLNFDEPLTKNTWKKKKPPLISVILSNLFQISRKHELHLGGTVKNASPRFTSLDQ